MKSFWATQHFVSLQKDGHHSMGWDSPEARDDADVTWESQVVEDMLRLRALDSSRQATELTVTPQPQEASERRQGIFKRDVCLA